ncbi:MAG: hypothetical protein Q9213_002323 [Squamulea squamosa]
MALQACSDLFRDDVPPTSTLNRLSRIPYQFQLPGIESPSIAQDAELVDVMFRADTENASHTKRIRFHDHQLIYSYQGPYKSLFHGHLGCQSPQKLVALLAQCMGPSNKEPGNRCWQQYCGRRADRSLGRSSADFLVQIFTKIDTQFSALNPKAFGVLVVRTALGPDWGDLPVEALLQATKYLVDGGLVAITMNLKWLSDKSTESNIWNDFDQPVERGKC